MCMSCGHTPIYKNIAYVLYVPNWWHRFFLMALELRCLLKYPTSSHAHVEEISEQQRQMDEGRYEEKLMMRSQSEVKVWCVWTLGIPKSNGNTHHSPLTLPQDYYWIFIHIYSMSEAPAMLNDGKPWDCCYVFPFPPDKLQHFLRQTQLRACCSCVLLTGWALNWKMSWRQARIKLTDKEEDNEDDEAWVQRTRKRWRNGILYSYKHTHS